MNAPLYLARSGNIHDDSIYSAGGGGEYWSSTVDNPEATHRLNFGSAVVNPESNSHRYRGFSLRCVLRES